MHITINFSMISEHILAFDITFPTPVRLKFDALTVGNGIEVNHLRADTSITIDNNILSLSEPCHITYELHTKYRDVVGDDRDLYVMYPFINDNEVFFGVGAVPYPLNYANIDCPFSYELTNVPAGWQVYSNLDSPNPGKLEGFFVYVVKGEVETGTFVHGETIFHWLKQPGKDIPLSEAELASYVCNYVNWLETNIGPFLPAAVKFLFLQAPRDFEERANQRTFTTGQNFYGGILTVGPNAPDYLRKLFGYDDYRFFLFDGITHELMHYYTTSSWQGKHKAHLYPAPDASPYTRRLIGEALNIYFHRQYLYEYWYGSSDRFEQVDMLNSIERAKQRNARAPLADLHLLDKALRANGTTLLEQFQRLVLEKKPIRRPMALVEGLPQDAAIYIDENVTPAYLAKSDIE